MTAPTVTEPQLALARTAAEAALGVLPTSRELTAGPTAPAGPGTATSAQPDAGADPRSASWTS